MIHTSYRQFAFELKKFIAFFILFQYINFSSYLKAQDLALGSITDYIERKTQIELDSFSLHKISKDTIYQEMNTVFNPFEWSRYNFLPCEKIIFDDSALSYNVKSENIQWLVYEGKIEINKMDEVSVVFNSPDTQIVPIVLKPELDYLPDVFSIEFDLFRPKNTSGYFGIVLSDLKHQVVDISNQQEFRIFQSVIQIVQDKSLIEIPQKPIDFTQKEWIHISMFYQNNKLKLYMDYLQIVNIPFNAFNPSGITLKSNLDVALENTKYQIKNFRIATGFNLYNERIFFDRKIVESGIKFDTDRTSLKPESMGPINKIYYLMEQIPDLKLSVEGHTNGLGDEKFNKLLSEKRAKIVVDILIKKGINQDRLKYKGFGSSKPVTNNITPEGRAQNMRIEFVEF